MSRQIDNLPQPTNKKKTKVAVASCSRSGTLGLYRAMKTLGYTPYHMVELVTEGGLPHMKILQEAIHSQNKHLGIKRYEKADFEKWMGNYDCIIEMPSYAGMDFFKSYADDPDIKFILTERDPARWALSVKNTLGRLIEAMDSFPLNTLKYFDTHLGAFVYLAKILYWALSDGTDPGDPNTEMAMRRHYVEYMESVKKILPKDRLLAVKLEDGLGWEQICPFLGLPIPDEEYPRGNEPGEFQAIVEGWMRPWIQAAAGKLGAVVVPVLGVVGYFVWTRMLVSV